MAVKHKNPFRSLRGQAFKEEQYATVEGTRCVEIRIPDDDSFLPQLAGLVAMATKQYQYQNRDEAKAAIIAQQWKDAYLETDWEQCMNCEDVQNCIETHEGTQDALDNRISNYLAINNFDTAGNPLTPTQTAEGLQGTTNPTCDLDIVWAQSLMLVKTTDAIVRDLLNKFETLTNPVELTAAAIDAIPLFGDVGAVIPQMIGILQNFLAENYEADYTTTPVTGYEDVLACEYFCSAKGDCNFTIDRIFGILLARIDARFSTGQPVFDTLNELAAFVLGIDTGGEFIADLCHFLIWGGLKLANFVFGGLLNRPTIGTEVITVWLTLAVNDANDDWLTICEECPAFENIVYEANPIQSGLTLNVDGEQFLGGDNRIIYSPYQATITLPVERRLRSIEVIMAEATETGNQVIIETVEYDLIRGTFHGGSTYTYTADIPDVLCQIIDFQFINVDANNRVIISGVNSFVLEAWEI